MKKSAESASKDELDTSVEEPFTTIITRGKMTPSYLSGLSKVHYQKSPDYIRDKLYENLRQVDRSKSTSLLNKKKFLQMRRALGQNYSISTSNINKFEKENQTNRYNSQRRLETEIPPGPYGSNQIVRRRNSLRNIPLIPDKAYGRIP